MGVCVCVCMCLSFCLFFCFIDRLVIMTAHSLNSEVWPAFTLQRVTKRCFAESEQKDHTCAFNRVGEDNILQKGFHSPRNRI